MPKRLLLGCTLLLLLAVWGVLACGDGGPGASGGGSAPDAALDEAEVEQLRALGYVDVVESPGGPGRRGVVLRDPERSGQGLVHFTNAHGCSAELIRPDGEVVHRWHQEPCEKWGNTLLLPDGDLLVVHREPADDDSALEVHRARVLMRLSWDGQVVWRRRMPVHHDVDLTPRGQVATLTYEHRIIPEIHPSIPVRDHFVALLTADGEPIEEVSLTELLMTAPEVMRLRRIAPHHKEGMDEIDLLHSNSIEWMHYPELAERSPIYAESNFLVSLRHQDAVAIIDWDAKRLVWAWGQGHLSGPHDASMLPNGHVLVFDNGLARRWSRVVEIDPLAGRIVWEYRADDPLSFFTYHRGSAQRLRNGNTLITDSGAGRVFEVTPGGEVVWDFHNPNLSADGSPIVVVRARRLPQTDPDDRPFTRVD
jgi:hypothetical protein